MLTTDAHCEQSDETYWDEEINQINPAALNDFNKSSAGVWGQLRDEEGLIFHATKRQLKSWWIKVPSC